MKSSVFALVAPLLVIAGPVVAAPTAADPSIILGKYFPPVQKVSVYAAWASLSNPCTTATFLALASPIDQGLCGHPFTAGSNRNFTKVEAEDCSSGIPNIDPVKANASPPQLCIPLSHNNVTCPNGAGIFEADFLCGGPLTT